MGFMATAPRAYPLAARARGEAFAGLVLLLLGLTVLTFWRCPTTIQHNHRGIGVPLQTGSAPLPPSVGFGNAREDSRSTKGWWVGHFAEQGSAQHTTAVETKWASHAAGTRNEGWATNKVATSMAVLISGRQMLEFKNSHVVLENQGDYVIWGPGVAHTWTALEASTLLCVRWPSLPGDQGPGPAANATASAARVVAASNATAAVRRVVADVSRQTVKKALQGQVFDGSTLTGATNE